MKTFYTHIAFSLGSKDEVLMFTEKFRSKWIRLNLQKTECVYMFVNLK